MPNYCAYVGFMLFSKNTVFFFHIKKKAEVMEKKLRTVLDINPGSNPQKRKEKKF